MASADEPTNDDDGWWERELQDYQETSTSRVRGDNIFDVCRSVIPTSSRSPGSPSRPISMKTSRSDISSHVDYDSDDEDIKSLSQLADDDHITTITQADRRVSFEDGFPDIGLCQSPDHVLAALARMVESLNHIANQAFISDDVKHGLSEAREALDKVTVQLEDEDKKETKNDVDAVLNLDHLPWHFDNGNVAAYRARAYQFPHQQFLQNDLHIPRYLSGGVLPKNTPDSMRCNVIVMWNSRPQHIELLINNHDTAATMMGRVYDSFESRSEAVKVLGEPSSNIIKMVGQEEYIHGPEPLYNYETVRACLRNLQVVEVSLVRRPEPKVVSESAMRLPDIYKERVDHSLPILTLEDFTETRATTPPWDQLTYLPLRSLRQDFRYRVKGVENVSETILPRLDATVTHLKVRLFLFHGTQIIPNSDMCTTDAARSQAPRWTQWLSPGEGLPHIQASSIPRETRISALLYGKRTYTKEEELLSWVNIPLVDQFGHVRSGILNLKMWSIEPAVKQGHLDALTFVFRGTTVENLTRTPNIQHVSVCIEFEQRALPVTTPIVEPFHEPDLAVVGEKQLWKKLAKDVRQNLDSLIKTDPLYVLTPRDKEVFWMTRHHLLPYPLALPKFLQSVNWTLTDHRNEAHRLLSNWTPPLNPVSALELLDARYADYKVREYAVNCLRVLPDDELQIFLLQLAQSIKNEPYHDSPLTRFLIERALRNPLGIGHFLFWHLKAELHNPFHCERFAMILEEYLFHSSWHAAELRKQFEIVLRLQRISGRVVSRKHAKDIPDDDIQAEYLASLHKFNDNYLVKNGSTQIPLNPRWMVTTLIIDKCRFMSSKMAPLWLCFKNSDPLGDNVVIMFKSGDDLRQDILTLQLLKVMDKIWVSEDLDMRLIPYNCVSTGINSQGKGVGLIEIVLNSDTTSGIQLKYGGGALGAFKLDPLQKFLSDHNKDPKQGDVAKDNFIKSCAGYCVATYVLGIGDRHNGNIMLTKDGHLFHIDFGHFLGNFKSKFGIKRERAAFVLTPEMAFVMGGKNYKKAKEFRVFTDLSAQAFTILRNHASLFINLFSLMVSAQMPELMFHEDINYLRDKFFLQDTEKGAIERLRKEIQKSLSTTYRQFDNLIHNIKHG